MVAPAESPPDRCTLLGERRRDEQHGEECGAADPVPLHECPTGTGEADRAGLDDNEIEVFGHGECNWPARPVVPAEPLIVVIG